MAVYIDYSKAFDTVSHPKLFHKLSAYGIGGNVLAWIIHLLTDRTQKTRVSNSLSESACITSGVVQGSCLGPLLFLLYINDVTSVITGTAKCKLYADDLKLYTEIGVPGDLSTLQSAINNVKIWSDTWQLEMSLSKCASMCIGHNVKNSEMYQYHIDNHELPMKNTIVDLGVTTDSELKYSEHINLITSKAKRRTGLLFRCFATRDINVLRKAFVTYIRPLVEYGSSVWSPVQIGLIDKVESVQRQFTKRIPALHGLSYQERLTVLNLDSLEVRRLRADLCLLYRNIFGLCAINVENLFTLRDDVARPTRGHPYKIIQEHCVSKYRKNFFIQRVASTWNSLPVNLVDFSSFITFKRSLMNINLRTFTRF